MKFRLTLVILLTFIVFSCSNDKKIVYEPSTKVDPFEIYKEAMEAFEINDFFMLAKSFLKQS